MLKQIFKVLIIIVIIGATFENNVRSQSIFGANIFCEKGAVFFGDAPVNEISREDRRQGFWILSSCQDSSNAIIIHTTELDSIGNFINTYAINDNQLNICDCKEKNLKIYISAHGNYHENLKSGLWHYFDSEGYLIAVSLFKDDILQQASIFRDNSLGQVDFISISGNENNYDLFKWSDALKTHEHKLIDYDTVIRYLASSLMRSR